MKRTAWAVIVVGGVAALAAWLALVFGSPDTVGSPDLVERALRTATGPVEVYPESSPGEVASGTRDAPADSFRAGPAEGRIPQAAALPDDQPHPLPVGLRIEGIGVDAPIDPYGVVSATGQMDVPENVTDVAWYRFGPSPGESGSAVLAAHVDLAGQGPGVFFELGTLTPGDRIHVAYDDESERTFRVVARTTYEKDDLPLDVLFAEEGPPVLTLVTCGGAFSRADRRYDSNVVVYAVPVEPDVLPSGAS
jgi:sortase (surface protein transpeptidase)